VCRATNDLPVHGDETLGGALGLLNRASASLQGGAAPVGAAPVMARQRLNCIWAAIDPCGGKLLRGQAGNTRPKRVKKVKRFPTGSLAHAKFLLNFFNSLADNVAVECPTDRPAAASHSAQMERA
jgi:hypothetical protein